MTIKQIAIFLLIALCLTGYSQVFTSQQGAKILGQLPAKFKNGLVVYPKNDSIYFVFRAADYLGFIENDSVPDIRSDSVDEANYLNFFATLRKDKNQPCTFLAEIKYKNSKIFPNDYVLRKLFSSHNMFIFQNTSGTCEKIDYQIEKKKGFNRKWVFTVTQKHSARVLFKTSFGTITN